MNRIFEKTNILNLVLFVLVMIWAIGILFLYNINDVKNKEKIYFVSKSITENRQFWGVLEDGARLAANSNDKELIVLGPQKEIQIDEQKSIMEDVINKKPYGIIIAATDYEQIGEVCDKAMKNKIPLVAVDSDMNTKKAHSIVATDNKKAAKMLAKEVARLVDGGKYAIVSHVKGVKTTTDRAIGFKTEMDKYDGYECIGEYYSNNSLEGAIKQTEKILKNNDVKIIFGTNEITLEGIGKVIEKKGLQDKIFIAGFDTNKQIIYYMETGSIDKVMIQKPFNMGYLAVEELIKNKNSGKVNNIDTEAVMVNKDSIFYRANSKLIFPIEFE